MTRTLNPFNLLLPLRRPAPHARARLVCLPFAGGNAAAFREWRDAFGPEVNVCAVELPGRGGRIAESPIDSMDRLVERLLAALAPLFDLPVYLFGHSMGGRIAFEVAHREPRVTAVVASASRAPSLPSRHQVAHLPAPAFVEAIEAFGQASSVVLRDRELRERLMPSLRADFKLSESYRAAPDATISVPLTVLVARDDLHVELSEARGWRAHARGRFSFVELDRGGHFFLTTRRESVLSVVRGALAER